MFQCWWILDFQFDLGFCFFLNEQCSQVLSELQWYSYEWIVDTKKLHITSSWESHCDVNCVFHITLRSDTNWLLRVSSIPILHNRCNLVSPSWDLNFHTTKLYSFVTFQFSTLHNRCNLGFSVLKIVCSCLYWVLSKSGFRAEHPLSPSLPNIDLRQAREEHASVLASNWSGTLNLFFHWSPALASRLAVAPLIGLLTQLNPQVGRVWGELLAAAASGSLHSPILRKI